MEFEIIEVKDIRPNTFKVVIEIKETRKRKSYCYPKSDGWDKEIDGKPKFVRDIIFKLAMEEKGKNMNVKKMDKKLKGKKFKTN